MFDPEQNLRPILPLTLYGEAGGEAGALTSEPPGCEHVGPISIPMRLVTPLFDAKSDHLRAAFAGHFNGPTVPTGRRRREDQVSVGAGLSHAVITFPCGT